MNYEQKKTMIKGWNALINLTDHATVHIRSMSNKV